MLMLFLSGYPLEILLIDRFIAILPRILKEPPRIFAGPGTIILLRKRDFKTFAGNSNALICSYTEVDNHFEPTNLTEVTASTFSE